MRGHELPDRFRRTAPGRIRWLAFPLSPVAVRRFGAEVIAARSAPRMVAYMAEVGARPRRDPETGIVLSPQVYSEREMRKLDPGAVLWRPGRAWLVVELEDDNRPRDWQHGKGPVHYVDPEPDG